MSKLSLGVLPLAAALLISGACSGQPDNVAAPPGTSPLAPAMAPPVVPPPEGRSYQNCRGGRNINWWVSRIDDVTAADLAALVERNLTQADRSPFDPADTAALRDWLRQGARSRNIFYAVSAQLAVAVLNVRHGFVHESGTFVLVDQANRELAAARPSIGWLETLLYEFNRCQ